MSFVQRVHFIGLIMKFALAAVDFEPIYSKNTHWYNLCQAIESAFFTFGKVRGPANEGANTVRAKKIIFCVPMRQEMRWFREHLDVQT
jgi:hypothetical protein